MRFLVPVFLIGLLLALPGVSLAQSPTVTPAPSPTMRAYSRGELLQGIGVKPYTLLDIPDLNMAPRIGGMVTEGGSWFVTLMYLITDSGAAQLIFYLLSMLFIVGFLLTILHRVMRGQTYARYHDWREGVTDRARARWRSWPYSRDVEWAAHRVESDRRFRHRGGKRRR